VKNDELPTKYLYAVIRQNVPNGQVDLQISTSATGLRISSNREEFMHSVIKKVLNSFPDSRIFRAVDSSRFTVHSRKTLTPPGDRMPATGRVFSLRILRAEACGEEVVPPLKPVDSSQ